MRISHTFLDRGRKAVVCSWQRNRSIHWAVIAGLLSWAYVAYFAITRRPDETRGGY